MVVGVASVVRLAVSGGTVPSMASFDVAAKVAKDERIWRIDRQ